MAPKSEYVRLSSTEKIFGTKALLHAQLETLNTLKHLKEYKKLRNEEFLLKVQLKSQITESLALLKEFEKKLPKTSFVHKTKKKDEKTAKMESELAQIKEKLVRLQ